jgi:hypothetical protein
VREAHEIFYGTSLRAGGRVSGLAVAVSVQFAADIFWVLRGRVNGTCLGVQFRAGLHLAISSPLRLLSGFRFLLRSALSLLLIQIGITRARFR